MSAIFTMKEPDGNLWGNPGFPSLAVSYTTASGFFFSGDMGLIIFCALENYQWKNHGMLIFCCLSGVF